MTDRSSEEPEADEEIGEEPTETPPQSALPEEPPLDPSPIAEYLPEPEYENSSYSFEFSDGSIPPASWAKIYEELAPGTFRDVFVPAYIEERRLVSEEAAFRRSRDADLREQFREDQARTFHLAQRGQTMGFIALITLIIVVLIIAFTAILKEQPNVAIAALALLGASGLAIALVRLIIAGNEKKKSD